MKYYLENLYLKDSSYTLLVLVVYEPDLSLNLASDHFSQVGDQVMLPLSSSSGQHISKKKKRQKLPFVNSTLIFIPV